MARVKISVTLDPDVLQLVDQYVRDNDGLDRSKVLEEALGLWLAKRQARAMEAQYVGDDDVPEEELSSWRAIRREATAKRLARQ